MKPVVLYNPKGEGHILPLALVHVGEHGDRAEAFGRHLGPAPVQADDEAALALPHPVIRALAPEQILVRPLLDDPAPVEHDDLVGGGRPRPGGG